MLMQALRGSVRGERNMTKVERREHEELRGEKNARQLCLYTYRCIGDRGEAADCRQTDDRRALADYRRDRTRLLDTRRP
jgi:hypothetical protein